MPDCVICEKPNSAFNYGIFSCNACTMFYRRALTTKNNLFPCHNEKRCFEGKPFNLKCRMCRFEKCLASGMKTIHSTVTHSLIRSDTDSSLSVLLKDLMYRDDFHTDLFMNFIPISDVNPSVEDVIRNSNSVQLIQKPLNHAMTLDKWSILCQYSNIELIKNCNFVKLLSAEDQYTLINSTKMQFIMMKFAATAKFEKQSQILFPGGIDFLPVHTGLPFEHGMRYRLLGRFKELDITREEFLLFGMLLLCNPTITGLSEYATTLITSYQQKFTSSLLEYCQLKYQSGGPTRFTDILSLFHVMTRVHKDMEAYSFWVKYKFPEIQTKKLVTDSFQEFN